MLKLQELIEDSEDWLIDRVLSHTKRHGFTRYSSTLREAWRVSIVGISASISKLLRASDEIPQLDPDDSYTNDPVSAFGVLEAKRHRERGVSLEMFLGCFKYYRQSYVDLVCNAEYSRDEETRYRLYLERCFDRMEIGFVAEWARATDEEKIKELQARNRVMTNEKNRFLTMVESHSDPAILIDERACITYLNQSASWLAGTGPGGGNEFDSASRRSVEDARREPSSNIDPNVHVGESICSVFPWLREPLETFVAGSESTIATEIELSSNDGATVLRVRLSRMCDISEKYSGVVIFLSDVTQERLAERELRAGDQRLIEANRMLTKVLDTIPVRVFWKDTDLNFLGCNRLFAQDAGFVDPAEIVGKNDHDMSWAGTHADLYRHDDRHVMKTRTPKVGYEEPQSSSDGRDDWLRTSKVPMIHPNGDVLGVLGTYEIITARKKMELALQQSEEKHRTLFETMSQGVVYQDSHGNITSANPAAQRILGLTLDQMQGRSSMDPRWKAIRKDGSDWNGDDHPAMLSLRTGKRVNGAVMGVFHPTDNAFRWLVIDSVPQFQPGEDTPHQVYTTFQDITERKKAEDELRVNGEILENMAEGVFLIRSEDGVIVYANRSFERMFGYEPGELDGRHVSVVNAPGAKSPDETATEIMSALGRDGRWSGEIENVRKDGEPFWCSARVSTFVHPEFGEVWVSVHEDITARKEIQSALQRSEEQYRSLFENLNEGFCLNEIILDDDGVPTDYRFLEINPAFETLTGLLRGDVLGKTVREVLPGIENDPADWIGRYGKVALTGEELAFEDYSEPLQRWYQVNVFSPQRGRFAATFTDITERREAGRQLKEYAEAKEVLLREVNHRVKNNLSAIISMLHEEERKAQLSGQPAIEMSLQDLIVRVRGLSTVHSMLSARGWKPLRLRELCEEVITTSLDSLSHSALLKIDVDGNGITVDSNQAHQITLVLNELATNTIKHAAASDDGAEVRVSIWQANNEIALEYRDDGPGYPEEMLRGDFSRANTGLRLVRGITRKSLRGNVDVVNDSGAVTRLTFPVAG